MPSKFIATLRLITKLNLPPGHDGCVPHAVVVGVIDYSDWLILTPVAPSPSKSSSWKGKGDLETEGKGW